MKRLFIWVLIFQFTTGYNMLEEVLRLPMLLDHYQLHQAENPGLAFSTFLSEHYLNVRHQHASDAHAKLPLHCSHGNLAESTLPCPLPGIELPIPDIADQRSSKMPQDDTSLPSGDYESGLFRPPIA